MNKKKLSISILFIVIFSISFSLIERVPFEGTPKKLNLEYTINKNPHESIIIFYISDPISYYHWRQYDKSKFDKEVFNFILNRKINKINKEINIIVRIDFFPFKKVIVYSKKYDFKPQVPEG